MKYTENDFRQKCIDLKLTYIGFHKKHHDGSVIEFICPKHSDKGVQTSAWYHLKNETYGCSYCSGRHKTNADIIPLIKNKNVELISEYKGNEKYINCKCKECGNEWTTLPKILITNGAGALNVEE